MKYSILGCTAAIHAGKMIGLLAFFSLFFTSCYKEVEPGILDDHFFSGEVDIRHRYDAIRENQKTVVYSENFSTGLGGWPTINANGLTTTRIGGKYVLENTRNDLIRWVNRDINLNDYPDFEFECNIRIVSSSARGGGIGLSNANGDLVGLVINTDNEVSCFSIDEASGNTTRHKDAEMINGLNPTAARLRLTIRRIEGKYYFFVDKKPLLLEVSADLFTPTMLSLVLSGAVSMEIDNITLRSIRL